MLWLVRLQREALKEKKREDNSREVMSLQAWMYDNQHERHAQSKVMYKQIYTNFIIFKSLWVGGQISFWLTAELARETSYSVNKLFLVTMAPKHKNMQEFRDNVVAKRIVLSVLLITSLTL